MVSCVVASLCPFVARAVGLSRGPRHHAGCSVGPVGHNMLACCLVDGTNHTEVSQGLHCSHVVHESDLSFLPSNAVPPPQLGDLCSTHPHTQCPPRSAAPSLLALHP